MARTIKRRVAVALREITTRATGTPFRPSEILKKPGPFMVVADPKGVISGL
jgi:hypothetical protein